MATIKLGNANSASKAINYAEKRATEKSSYNCDVDYAKSNFKQLRMAYGKDDGIQAHTVIQSFKPNETTKEQANQIGLELAKEIAPHHQVAVYTHDDTNHIHNHIIINSVNLEDGKKYQSNAKQRHFIRNKSDEICLSHGLSVVEEKTKAVRYTLAERELIKKGKTSWKNEIRKAINYTKENSTDFDDLKTKLKRDFGIDTKLRGKTLSFKHPNQKRYVRANKLGYDFEKEALEHGFRKNLARETDWNEFEGTIEQSRPREETQKHAISERSADGTHDSDERTDGKHTPDEREPISSTSNELEQNNRELSEENERANARERRKARERDEGMEM